MTTQTQHAGPDERALPPLPAPVILTQSDTYGDVRGYTADQMQAYAYAALLADSKAGGEVVACLVGMKGSAFDSPKTKRAYTYAEQPGNVVASKLGKASHAAASRPGGDNIDAGLSLLNALQVEGFGVFDLGAEYTSHPQQQAAQAAVPLTDEQIDAVLDAAKIPEYPGCECIDKQIARG